ncbi:uroporphyrinogen-III C-methyltransferase [Halobiforma lacisalsi AJ5]|uniref:uroporphyrinogen-III C-methyltransferase n=1 Tax=Natronobacterium lacisalsi AJ5 TaxID=358396 RepID=M0LQG5_NATLA|nr:uroporphyrinogen-III C-methyltransferase [Halobiforma lacisalsi]APW96975.1 uroporphyrinogen-III C-methyltransferase [Halobiforma lacisalsi AJ5]EMA34689.1 uroporphyrin-III C-methyltransferase [Halobiforma lacisalsi AJ5]
MEIEYHGGEPEPGTVYLVGSGPGDPGLLTVKAKRLLERADVVLHDKLPGPEILGDLPDERCIDVGKRAHGDRTPQSEINERLVELADEGKSVVRLKGGDSFVFGRGGEEAEYLAEHGVPFEVVPAVTSAVAAPAVAGIPVTHRDHASSVSFVTGHEDPTKEDSAVDWDALATAGGTIVVLMGVTRLPQYVTALQEGGMDPETPAALVERGTWQEQRVATGTLETIVDARDEVGIEPPAVTVIGDVAASRESVVEFLENEREPGRAESETDAVPADVPDS